MARNLKCKAIENRVWLRASKYDKERMLDVWERDGETAYRRLVLELGKVYG